MLRDFRDHDYNVILKSRQLGISTLSAGYALWIMTFFGDKNILVIATKQEVAKNLVTKVRVMHANLPSWLKQRCVEDNKLNLRYMNGSQIKAVSSGPEAARSEALSLLILDEAAFIDKIDDINISDCSLEDCVFKNIIGNTYKFLSFSIQLCECGQLYDNPISIFIFLMLSGILLNDM